MDRLSTASTDFVACLERAQCSAASRFVPYEFNVLESVPAIELGMASFVQECGCVYLRYHRGGRRVARVLPIGSMPEYVSAMSSLLRRGYILDLVHPAVIRFLPKCSVASLAVLYEQVGDSLVFSRRMKESVRKTAREFVVRPYAGESVLWIDRAWRERKGEAIEDGEQYTWALQNLCLLRDSFPAQRVSAIVAEQDGDVKAISVATVVNAHQWANVIRRYVSSNTTAYMFGQLSLEYQGMRANDGMSVGALCEWKRRCGLGPTIALKRVWL